MFWRELSDILRKRKEKSFAVNVALKFVPGSKRVAAKTIFLFTSSKEATFVLFISVFRKTSTSNYIAIVGFISSV